MTPGGIQTVMAADATTPKMIHFQMGRMTSTMCWKNPTVDCGALASSRREIASASVCKASVAAPPANPITSALTHLKMVNGQPRNEALTSSESTPVCGVLIRNPTAAPSLAPSFLSPSPAGMTPQEHNGSGTPNATALPTPPSPRNWRRAKSRGSNTWSKPAAAAPRRSQGAS